MAYWKPKKTHNPTLKPKQSRSGKGERMLQVHKKTPMDQYPSDIFALRSILLELGKRGHRLRYPEIKAENQTAPSENLLAGTPNEAAENEEVCNEHKPQPD
jgi:hypothetical protein